MCVSRLRSLHHQLRNEPNLLSVYDKIIREQEQDGIVERVPEEETTSDQSRGYYSPRHAVIRKERETTKVCIVYDGSAKSSKEELSLNDCLETGDKMEFCNPYDEEEDNMVYMMICPSHQVSPVENVIVVYYTDKPSII